MRNLIQGLDELGITDDDILECEYHELEDGGALSLRFTDKARASIESYCSLMNITFEQLARSILFPEDGPVVIVPD